MKVLQIDATGKRNTQEVSRKNVAASFDLPARDLRPVFSMSQVATIFARGKGIIMNLGILKLLVGTDQVIIANLDNTEVKDQFIPGLLKRIKNQEAESDFELKILEYALTHKIGKVVSTFETVEKSTSRLLKRISKNFDGTQLEELLVLKKRISKFEIIVKENEAAVIDLLDDDEDLEALCLTQVKKRRKNIDTEEVESILESFSEQLEQITHRVEELSENIDDTQEILSLKLHTRRNSIIRYDLMATLITALFSFFAVITGLFGMNILSNLENNHDAFWVILAVIIVGFLFFLGLSILYLKRKKIL